MIENPGLVIVRMLMLALLGSGLAFGVSSQVPGPPKTPTGFYYPLNSTFTNDANWLFCGQDYYSGLRHNGADLIVGVGTPVYAIGTGKVGSRSGPAERSGWGIGNYALAIRHPSRDGDFIAVYGHIQTSLRIGDEVTAGQQIGRIGKYEETVNNRIVTRTAHLHFGIFPTVNGFPSSGWGRVADTNCAAPHHTNGFVAPISFIRTKRPPGGDSTNEMFDLNGDWMGYGYNPGPYQNKVRIRQSGNDIEVIKITGTQTVPAGSVTWTGKYTSNLFPGKLRIAQENLRNAYWVKIMVRVLDRNTLVVHQAEDDPRTGGRDWGPIRFERIR